MDIPTVCEENTQFQVPIMPEPTEAADKGQGRRDKARQPETGVRECFQWADSDDVKRSKGQRRSQQQQQQQQQQLEDQQPEHQQQNQSEMQYQHKFISRKPDVGKSRNIGYTIPTPTPPKFKDEGSAGEALRGWPGHSQVEAPNYDDATRETPIDDDATRKTPISRPVADLTDEKNMNLIMSHRPDDEQQTSYIDGVPESPKKKPSKHMVVNEEANKIIEEMAKLPRKVKPAPRVESKQTKQFDNTLTGRRAWRS